MMIENCEKFNINEIPTRFELMTAALIASNHDDY